MGFLGTAMKVGIAKKAWNEARKPKNQAKAKQLLSKLTGGDKAARSRRR